MLIERVDVPALTPEFLTQADGPQVSTDSAQERTWHPPYFAARAEQAQD